MRRNTTYKGRLMGIWNEIAPRYHKRWSSTYSGPFRVSASLVRDAGIRRGQTVLDVGCGTGALTKKISVRIGAGGMVIGLDMSRTALQIAKKFAGASNTGFILADAEAAHFAARFDAVTCQYALFFFPDSEKALRGARRALKKDGTLAVAVHGNNVPFFTCILDEVEKFIPGYAAPGDPRLDRFGTQKSLRKIAMRCGFTHIKTRSMIFWHSPGTFADYWNGYTRYVAKPVRAKLGTLSHKERNELREAVRRNTIPYTRRGGKIMFPWQVLVMTAKK